MGSYILLEREAFTYYSGGGRWYQVSRDCSIVEQKNNQGPPSPPPDSTNRYCLIYCHFGFKQAFQRCRIGLIKERQPIHPRNLRASINIEKVIRNLQFV